tara:strand:- start:1134 stop:1550 length:417 start_codon:yes stop_codon:yes gene_type:complete
MKAYLDNPLLDLRGEEMKRTPPECQGAIAGIQALAMHEKRAITEEEIERIKGLQVPFRVADAVCDALTAVIEGEKLDGKTKIERFDLARRVIAGGEQSFTVTEASQIIKAADTLYGVLVYGQIHAIFDDKEEEPHDAV